MLEFTLQLKYYRFIFTQCLRCNRWVAKTKIDHYFAFIRKVNDYLRVCKWNLWPCCESQCSNRLKCLNAKCNALFFIRLSTSGWCKGRLHPKLHPGRNDMITSSFLAKFLAKNAAEDCSYMIRSISNALIVMRTISLISSWKIVFKATKCTTQGVCFAISRMVTTLLELTDVDGTVRRKATEITPPARFKPNEKIRWGELRLLQEAYTSKSSPKNVRNWAPEFCFLSVGTKNCRHRQIHGMLMAETSWCRADSEPHWVLFSHSVSRDVLYYGVVQSKRQCANKSQKRRSKVA